MLKKLQKPKKGRSILFDLAAEQERAFEEKRRTLGLSRAAFARMLVMERLGTEKREAA